MSWGVPAMSWQDIGTAGSGSDSARAVPTGKRPSAKARSAANSERIGSYSHGGACLSRPPKIKRQSTALLVSAGRRPALRCALVPWSDYARARLARPAFAGVFNEEVPCGCRHCRNDSLDTKAVSPPSADGATQMNVSFLQFMSARFLGQPLPYRHSPTNDVTAGPFLPSARCAWTVLRS